MSHFTGIYHFNFNKSLYLCYLKVTIALICFSMRVFPYTETNHHFIPNSLLFLFPHLKLFSQPFLLFYEHLSFSRSCIRMYVCLYAFINTNFAE